MAVILNIKDNRLLNGIGVIRINNSTVGLHPHRLIPLKRSKINKHFRLITRGTQPRRHSKCFSCFNNVFHAFLSWEKWKFTYYVTVSTLRVFLLHMFFFSESHFDSSELMCLEKFNPFYNWLNLRTAPLNQVGRIFKHDSESWSIYVEDANENVQLMTTVPSVAVGLLKSIILCSLLFNWSSSSSETQRILHLSF